MKHLCKFIVAPDITHDRTESSSWAQGFTAHLVTDKNIAPWRFYPGDKSFFHSFLQWPHGQSHLPLAGSNPDSPAPGATFTAASPPASLPQPSRWSRQEADRSFLNPSTPLWCSPLPTRDNSTAPSSRPHAALCVCPPLWAKEKGKIRGCEWVDR